MRKNNIIPFNWLPASWGLTGPAYDEAETYYNYDGEDLQRKLIKIRNPNEKDCKLANLALDHQLGKIDNYTFDTEVLLFHHVKDSIDHKKAVLALDLKYGKISAYTHDIKIAEIDFPDIESMDYQLAVLNTDFIHGKIEKTEYEKTVATAKNEPWVGILNDGFKAEEGVNGLYFELDWNTQWVDYLRKHGYHGFSEEQIVEQWFSDVCRSQIEENPMDDGEPVPFNSTGRIVRRISGDDGTSEYS